ncbi:methylated-DNA--[protein]-cysteine S-methyltransferase [Cytobacillus sp. Hz8]|uniref:methylated-DNA--[protein]-cysteine S-methyltransferase n=1 Tax=Cytobacillus sp. Hz8 TaxID=3347168 RepID=UPI0035D66722
MYKREYMMFASEIDQIFVVAENEKIVEIYLGKEDFLNAEIVDEVAYNEENPLLKEAVKQLEEYFHGKRQDFSLPLEIQGTAFQQSVWQELLAIPFGETRSYQDIAVAIENPKAVRAIGQANKANHIPIIIPCHRVIGKNQSLTGYAGTRTDIKEKLLLLEGAHYKN